MPGRQPQIRFHYWVEGFELEPRFRTLSVEQNAFVGQVGFDAVNRRNNVAVAYHVMGAPNPQSPLYEEGIQWGGNCFAMYSAVCFGFSFALEPLAPALGGRRTHGLCLLAGALGLLSVSVIHDKYLLLLSMVGIGIAWASTLSMPYAILAGALPPNKVGIYMGIFNFFIVTPEIIASLGLGRVMNHVLGNNRLAAVVCGGAFLAIAAVLAQRVEEPGRMAQISCA
jgi:maltose/moltooligosaccharide transporter